MSERKGLVRKVKAERQKIKPFILEDSELPMIGDIEAESKATGQDIGGY